MPLFVPTTWNPSDKGAAVTLSNGDLSVNYSAYTGSNCRSVAGQSTGKWYWELTLTTRSSSAALNMGVWPSSRSIATYIYNTTGVVRVIPEAHAQGDVFGLAFDAAAGTLAVTRNGTALSTLSGLVISELWHPVIGDDNASGAVVVTANFGATAFVYTPPAGFNAGFGVSLLTLSGVVDDSSGAPAARAVRAYLEETGVYVGGVISNATTGAYSIPTAYDGAHTVIAYPVSGEGLPALTLSGVIPV